MNNIKTINEGWLEYERACVPKDASQAQRTATQEAFYAGAGALYILATSDAFYKAPDDLSESMLRGWRSEMMVFADKKRRGL